MPGANCPLIIVIWREEGNGRGGRGGKGWKEMRKSYLQTKVSSGKEIEDEMKIDRPVNSDLITSNNPK